MTNVYFSSHTYSYLLFVPSFRFNSLNVTLAAITASRLTESSSMLCPRSGNSTRSTTTADDELAYCGRCQSINKNGGAPLLCGDLSVRMLRSLLPSSLEGSILSSPPMMIKVDWLTRSNLTEKEAKRKDNSCEDTHTHIRIQSFTSHDVIAP